MDRHLPATQGTESGPENILVESAEKPDTEEKLYTTSEIKAGDRYKVTTQRATKNVVNNQESKAELMAGQGFHMELHVVLQTEDIKQIIVSLK